MKQIKQTKKRAKKEISDQDAYKSLPKNRKEVFFDLLKTRKMNMFSLSCLVALFFIPLFIDLIYFNLIEMGAMATLEGNDLSRTLFSLMFYSLLIAIPCMIIGFFGLAGGFNVIKKMVWQEGIHMSQDFFQGIKENAKQCILLGFIGGLSLFGMVIGCSYLRIYAEIEPVWCGIGIGALIVQFIMFGIMNLISLAQIVFYSNSFKHTYKNAFSFLMLSNWRSIVAFIFSIGLTVGLCLINSVTLYIALFCFAIFNAWIILLFTLISHKYFDKYINKDNYPQFYEKGLYKSNEIIAKQEKEN